VIAPGTDLDKRLGQRVCPAGSAGCLPLASLGCRLLFLLREFFGSQTLLKLGVHLSKLFERAGW